jgi:branched-chain amino acid transport system substrate-binding protein
VIEDSVVAIVGDLVSRTAEPVAQKSDELGVANINLSQKSGLTDIGEYVFRNALTSEAQVRELVATAMDQYGMKRFAIMFPNDAYGVEFTNIFWDEVLSRGGQITAVQTYAPDEKDFAGVIRRLMGTYYLEDRQDEYAYVLKEWYSKQKRLTARVEPPDDLLPPIMDFDAIFIPDGVKALGQIASMLVYQGIGQTRLLGTNLWNTKELIDRGTKLSENSLFVDAKAAVDPSFSQSAFFREFKQVYGEDPTVFEAQAYDTGLILRRILTSGVNSRVALKDSLKELKEFSGAIGSVSVTEGREFSRPLVVLSNVEGQIAPIKPVAAPAGSSRR